MVQSCLNFIMGGLMFAIGSTVGNFVKRSLLGEHVDGMLQQAGRLCQEGNVESHASGWTIVAEAALKDCSRFANTCLKVAYVGTLLTMAVPFLFGSLVSSVAFASLTACVLTHDMEEVIRRSSQLLAQEGTAEAAFGTCQTVAARLEWMLRTTTFLRLMPTSWVETVFRFCGFFPSR